jgi:hypothetical protein
VTVTDSGREDAVLVEVYCAALGNEVPVALGYARFSRPQTKNVKLIAPKFVRRFLRARGRLRARVVLSQCSTAGYEYTAQRQIVLRRR